jgi:hypothetical protein
VYYRLLVHILINRWSSNNFEDKTERYSSWNLYTVKKLHSFNFMPDISLIITKYSRNKHWKKNFILFIWKSYKLNFNRVCSCDSDYNRSNIWKSELYINAEGQFFWNLKKFSVFGDSYVRKIDTLYLLNCELSFFITYSFNLIKYKS